MSYFIKIRHAGALQLPDKFDYQPANPSDPDSISLGGQGMSAVIGLMLAIKVLDGAIKMPSQRKDTAPGKVAAYKFLTSDGHHVTAQESRMIVDAFDQSGKIDGAWMAARFPKFDPSRADLVKMVQDLAEVWIAFNRVAAANDGYIVH
jgi:hypothetical protein